MPTSPASFRSVNVFGSKARLRAFAKRVGGVVSASPESVMYEARPVVSVEVAEACTVRSAHILPDGRVSIRTTADDFGVVDMAQFLRDLRGLSDDDRLRIMAVESKLRVDRQRAQIDHNRKVRYVA